LPSKPIIGITCRHTIRKEELVEFVNKGHTAAVHEVGGVPVFLPLLADGDTITRYLDIVDGLIVTEGADLNPQLYSESRRPVCKDPDDAKDFVEMSLIKGAVRRDLPILGVCRGVQLLNVLRGGSMYQDIAEEHSRHIIHRFPQETEFDCWHYVDLTPDTQLADIYGCSRLYVNSIHHQGIKQVPSELVVSATAEDGIVEGLEDTRCRFLVAVQWHPEKIWREHPIHLRPFQALLRAVRATAAD